MWFHCENLACLSSPSTPRKQLFVMPGSKNMMLRHHVKPSYLLLQKSKETLAGFSGIVALRIIVISPSVVDLIASASS